MKQTLFIIAAVTLTYSASAQEFAPVGAVWHYTEIQSFSPNVSYMRMESIGDTVVNGYTMRKVIGPMSCMGNGEHLFYQSGDSVFYWHHGLDTMLLAYDFGATAGDAWHILAQNDQSTPDTVWFDVDSAWTELINGDSLRAYALRWTAPTWGTVHDTVIERIGSLTFLSNFAKQTDVICDLNYPAGLRCYQDTVFGFYETGIALSCTHSTLGVDDPSPDQIDMAIFPNPADRELFVLFNGQVRLTDMLGREIHVSINVSKFNDTSVIDISSLPQGMYIIHARNERGYAAQMFIKESL